MEKIDTGTDHLIFEKEKLFDDENAKTYVWRNCCTDPAISVLTAAGGAGVILCTGAIVT